MNNQQRALADKYRRTEDRDGMRIDWHVPIKVADGTILDADVYRPPENGKYPVIMSHGLYAKGLAFQDEIYEMQWARLSEKEPAILEGSTNKYQSWEVVDPERWVPHGYICVRVDSRGAGWSPGFLNPRSDLEIEDFYTCIEWAATQPWSNGKVGLCGISYYALTQWLVAAKNPPSLAAIIPWEGYIDYYRGSVYHGGIRSTFQDKWYTRQVARVQYGVGDRALKSQVTGETIAGPETLSDEELAQNRSDLSAELRSRPLFDDWFAERAADIEKITVPLLSAANWGGQGIHAAGNFDGFTRASSEQKWLEVHGDTHYTHFYTAYGRGLQKRFFDHFLKGIDNGWDREPPVLLNIRHPGEHFELRKEYEWPLARTQWTKCYLNLESFSLQFKPIQESSHTVYEATGDGLLFSLPSSDEPLEVTGPLSAKLHISSSTTDADLFLVLQLFDSEGNEVTFEGANDPNTPVANGWLRASHRRLDHERSLPYQPFHPHDQVEPLEPGKIYELHVEIWPTCVVVPPGYKLALGVRGKDYEYKGDLDEHGKRFYYSTRGTGGITHDDPVDRPAELFHNRVTIHAGPDHPSHLLLPVIPNEGSQVTINDRNH